MLQICSCSGLVLRSHSWLCFLSCVRHRTSLICKPFPQEREHWGGKQGGRESVNNTVIKSCPDLCDLSHYFSSQHLILRPPLPPFPLISHRAPLCCEPLRLTLAHLTLLDRGRLVQMCTLTGWCHSKIISHLLDTNGVPSLSSIPTWDIALEKKTTTEKSVYLCSCVYCGAQYECLFTEIAKRIN